MASNQLCTSPHVRLSATRKQTVYRRPDAELFAALSEGWIYMKHCRAPRNHGNYLPQPDPVATSIVPILIPSSKMSSSSIPIRDRSQPSSDRRPSSRASSHQAPPSREGSHPPPTSRQSSRPWPTSRSSSRPATTAPASSDQPSSGQAAPAVRRALDDVLPAELLGSVASFLERVCTQAGHLSFH